MIRPIDLEEIKQIEYETYDSWIRRVGNEINRVVEEINKEIIIIEKKILFPPIQIKGEAK